MTPEALTETLCLPWLHGEHADLAGQRFNHPVHLGDMSLRSFDLSNAVFDAGLKAKSATFRGMAWFKHAQISGHMDLSGSTFRNDLRLDGLICDRLTLTDSRFEGVLDLDGARIGQIEMVDCLCLANVSLGGAVVSGQLDLSGSELMGGLWAEAAQIGGVEGAGLVVEGRRVRL